MSSLLRKYLVLKRQYRHYDSKVAIKKMQAFRHAVHKLSFKGFPVAMEILGSMDFGICNETSDTDAVVLFHCHINHGTEECPNSCENLAFIKNELIHTIQSHLGHEMNCNIEFLDWINLSDIEDFINTKNPDKEDIAFRFLYYRTLARPVNRPLIVKYSQVLEMDKDFLHRCNSWASEILESYLLTESHLHSFSKYNQRIKSSGLRFPERLADKLRSYLQ